MPARDESRVNCAIKAYAAKIALTALRLPRRRGWRLGVRRILLGAFLLLGDVLRERLN